MSEHNYTKELFSGALALLTVPIILVAGLFAGHSMGLVPMHLMQRLGLVNITSRSNSTATKAIMQSIKSALVNYQNDIGRYPHTGTKLSSATLLLANRYCLDSHASRNVLDNPLVGHPFEYNGLASATYAKRWKGPYIDGPTDENMLDCWGKKIRLDLDWQAGTDASGNPVDRATLYLQSAGTDGVFDPLAKAVVASYTGDDITIMVARTKIVKNE